MSYYNYHAMAKRLLKDGNCFSATIFEEYHHIKPALVLYFQNHKPIPIRQYMWEDYFEILNELQIKISNPNNISLN